MNPNALLEKLGTFGLDIDGVNSRFLGDTELYGICFAALMKDENIPRLKTAIENKDYQASFEAAHALKGFVGNLGLTRLYEVTCALVESLRGKRYDTVAQEYAVFDRLFEELTLLVAE